LEGIFPHLYSFCRKKHWSLKFFVEKDPEVTLFLPLLEQAADQLYDLDAILTLNLVSSESADSWEYNWGNTFSPKKAYNQLQGQIDASPIFKWIWNGGNLGKHKFFAWLLVRDRLSTRNLLKRKKCTWTAMLVLSVLLIRRRLVYTCSSPVPSAKPAGTGYILTGISTYLLTRCWQRPEQILEVTSSDKSSSQQRGRFGKSEMVSFLTIRQSLLLNGRSC
jgi:hypothetical protein